VDQGAERPIPTSVYIAGGATLALAAGGAVFGVIAKGKKDDFDAANDGTDPDNAKDLKSSADTMNLVADGLFLGAIIGAGVTTFLYVTRPEVPSSQAITVNPIVGPSALALTVSGSF
jgi:hypothetical protein